MWTFSSKLAECVAPLGINPSTRLAQLVFWRFPARITEGSKMVKVIYVIEKSFNSMIAKKSGEHLVANTGIPVASPGSILA